MLYSAYDMWGKAEKLHTPRIEPPAVEAPATPGGPSTENTGPGR